MDRDTRSTLGEGVLELQLTLLAKRSTLRQSPAIFHHYERGFCPYPGGPW